MIKKHMEISGKVDLFGVKLHAPYSLKCTERIVFNKAEIHNATIHVDRGHVYGHVYFKDCVIKMQHFFLRVSQYTVIRNVYWWGEVP